MSDTQSKQPLRVEVITSEPQGRRWPVAEKIRIVPECEQPGMSLPYVTRKYVTESNLLFCWRRMMREGGLSTNVSNFIDAIPKRVYLYNAG